MEKPKPIAENVTADLAVSDVLRFFRKHPEKDLKPTYPPLRPKGGEICIFYPEDDTWKSKLPILLVIQDMGSIVNYKLITIQT